MSFYGVTEWFFSFRWVGTGYESLATSDECLEPKNPSTLNTKMSGGIFGEGRLQSRMILEAKNKSANDCP